MSNFLPEGTLPLQSDNEKRSLHKVVDLEGGQDSGGGTVTGTGTANTVPLWTSSTALGNSFLTQDANGLLLATGKNLTVQGTGLLVVPDGSAAAPSIKRSASATGIFFSGDSFLVSIAGSAGLQVTSSGHLIPSTLAGALGISGSTTGGNIWTGLYLSSAAEVEWNADTALTRNAAGFVSPTTGFRVADGTAAAPSYSFSSDTDKGWRHFGAGSVVFGDNNAAIYQDGSGAMILLNGGGLFWSASPGTTAVNLALVRQGDNSLSQRNGTAAQTFSVYKTFISSGNSEYLTISSGLLSANRIEILQAAEGTGLGRNLAIGTSTASTELHLVTAGSTRWNINGSGHFLAGTDNTYDIGASGATRPRNIYLGTALYVAEVSAPSTPASGAGVVYAKTDNLLYFKNDAGTEFDLTSGSGNAKTVKFAKTAQTSISTATTASIVGTGSGSATLAANFFTVGKSVRIVGRGNLSNQGTPGNGTLNLKLGSTSVSSTGAQSLVANANIPYWFEAIITCRATGASGTIIANIMFSHGATATAYETWAGGVAESTVDTTGTLAVDIEWTFDTASNTFLSEILTIEEMALQ